MSPTAPWAATTTATRRISDTLKSDGGSPAAPTGEAASLQFTGTRVTGSRAHLAALIPGLLAVSVMLVWTVHNGGYDSDTWYWGALVLLAALAALIVSGAARWRQLSRRTILALTLFGLYVAWSYLSITWAQSPGDALRGSNRALLYLTLFALLALLPWTVEGALLAFIVFVFGVGVTAIVLLFRLASADHLARLVIEGRLAAPTGYFNATAALFTIGALSATALAARRELPALLRGALLASACAGLQLAVIVQSRGWLFTLPLIAILAIALARDRLRVVAAAVIPLAASLLPLRRLLDVYQTAPGARLDHVAGRAGQISLLICGGAFVVGSLLAWADQVCRPPPLGIAKRRAIGTMIALAAVAAASIGGGVATHGHPLRFISREWRGFSHVQASYSSTSHFVDVGSGRHDFWRVSLDAVIAHPIGGLGQDNFADYYVRHRRTGEEPSWTHSLELRLLAHTGIVGFALFAGFMIAALAAAFATRRHAAPDSKAFAASALLPLVVWLIYGSVDWFWEMPALSGPALGFLAVTCALSPPPVQRQLGRDVRRRRAQPRRVIIPRKLLAGTGAGALISATIVLGLPYLSVREVSSASDVRQRNPSAALSDLSDAARLDPLSADPGRIAGVIALQTRRYAEAERRFQQAIVRDPGGWFAWLGHGLAASALGETARARHDFEVAESINSVQRAIKQALAQVGTAHPLTPPEGLALITLTH